MYRLCKLRCFFRGLISPSFRTPGYFLKCGHASFLQCSSPSHYLLNILSFDTVESAANKLNTRNCCKYFRPIIQQVLVVCTCKRISHGLAHFSVALQFLLLFSTLWPPEAPSPFCFHFSFQGDILVSRDSDWIWAGRLECNSRQTQWVFSSSSRSDTLWGPRRLVSKE